jgi:uncharacterized protein YlxW (UPF0749 family)
MTEPIEGGPAVREPARPLPDPSGGSGALPDHVTRPLLSLVVQQSLDQDYQLVAERRRRGDLPREPVRTRVLASVVLAVFGLLIAVAAVQNSRDSEISDAGRASLQAQITQGKADLDRAQRALLALQQDNLTMERALERLESDVQTDSARLNELQTRTGYGVVHGPGVRVQVDSAPDAGERRLVRDEDLAKLVDGLWESGAEAISINDQRLTALTAIRNVGVAIHVNGRGLRPPYTIKAIGNRNTLGSDLLDTTHGSEFFSLADQLGFRYSVQNADDLILPAGPSRRLRSVQQGTGDDHPRGSDQPSASATATTEEGSP